MNKTELRSQILLRHELFYHIRQVDKLSTYLKSSFNSDEYFSNNRILKQILVFYKCHFFKRPYSKFYIIQILFFNLGKINLHNVFFSLDFINLYIAVARNKQMQFVFIVILLSILEFVYYECIL